MAKDRPCHVIRAASFSIVRGWGTTRCVRGRGGRDRGGAHRATYPVGDHCGQCYATPARLVEKASDVVIIGIIPIYFKFAFVLFNPGSTFSYVFIYFALVFNISCDPLDMPLCVSTLIGDYLVVDLVYQSFVVTFWAMRLG